MKRVSIMMFIVLAILFSILAPTSNAFASATPRWDLCPSIECYQQLKLSVYKSLENGYHIIAHQPSRSNHLGSCTYPVGIYKCFKSKKVEEMPATCTENGAITWHCSYCDYDFTESISKLGHNFTNYIPDDNLGTKTATCDRQGCDATDTIIVGVSKPAHIFERDVARDVSPTCTSTGIEAYSCSITGCSEREDQVIPALGHDFDVTQSEPTCTKDGVITYNCYRCSDATRIESRSRLGHWYGEWLANGDDTHSADCKRNRCSHDGTTECVSINVFLNGTQITICPICGNSPTDEQLVLMKNASVKASIDHGEAVIRRGVLSDGTEIMIVAFEYAGKLEKPKGIVKITLDLDDVDDYELYVLGSDGNENELVCSNVDGKLSFELDFSALANDMSHPAALIRLKTIGL